jgi:hypothetical protein
MIVVPQRRGLVKKKAKTPRRQETPREWFQRRSHALARRVMRSALVVEANR